MLAAVKKASDKLLRSVGRQASIIIAISSMLIAGFALYFTVQAQRADLEYKEISIQPRPSLGPYFEGMSLSVKNLGLGPAIVRQIDFERDGKCISSYGMKPGEWQSTYAEFLKAQAIDVFAKSLPPMPWIKGGKRKFNVEVDTLQYDDTVRANEDRYLFRLDPGTFKELVQADPDEQVLAKAKFAANAYRVPIIITFCSATDRTCMSVGEAQACNYLHQRARAHQ